VRYHALQLLQMQSIAPKQLTRLQDAKDAAASAHAVAR